MGRWALGAGARSVGLADAVADRQTYGEALLLRWISWVALAASRPAGETVTPRSLASLPQPF